MKQDCITYCTQAGKEIGLLCEKVAQCTVIVETMKCSMQAHREILFKFCENPYKFVQCALLCLQGRVLNAPTV